MIGMMLSDVFIFLIVFEIIFFIMCVNMFMWLMMLFVNDIGVVVVVAFLSFNIAFALNLGGNDGCDVIFLLYVVLFVIIWFF